MVFALFGFFQVGLGLTFFTLGSRFLPSGQASLIATLETPLMPFWVWLAFQEVPSVRALIGGATGDGGGHCGHRGGQSFAKRDRPAGGALRSGAATSAAMPNASSSLCIAPACVSKADRHVVAAVPVEHSGNARRSLVISVANFGAQ